MAKITITLTDGKADNGADGVRADFLTDTQGANVDAPPTPAFAVAVTIKRMWESGALFNLARCVCPEVIDAMGQSKTVPGLVHVNESAQPDNVIDFPGAQA